MLKKGAIRIADLSVDRAILGFFVRPKKAAGKFYLIVSMGCTNSFILHQKFRIVKTLEITRWVKAGYFVTSIDLSNAYFSILLKESEARFTRIQWRGTIYKYLCLMFGLGPSARVFTKMMAADFNFLRETFGILWRS